MLHAISPGDTIIEAPGACVIAPKVEPLSEMLKYKLLVVSVGSVSVDLCEEESDILLQVMCTYVSNATCHAAYLGNVLAVICDLAILNCYYLVLLHNDICVHVNISKYIRVHARSG